MWSSGALNIKEKQAKRMNRMTEEFKSKISGSTNQILSFLSLKYSSKFAIKKLSL